MTLARVIRSQRIDRVAPAQMAQISPEYYAGQRTGSVENDFRPARSLARLEISDHLGPIDAAAGVDERHQDLHLVERGDFFRHDPSFAAAVLVARIAGVALVNDLLHDIRRD